MFLLLLLLLFFVVAAAAPAADVVAVAGIIVVAAAVAAVAAAAADADAAATATDVVVCGLYFSFVYKNFIGCSTKFLSRDQNKRLTPCQLLTSRNSGMPSVEHSVCVSQLCSCTVRDTQCCRDVKPALPIHTGRHCCI